VRRQRWISSSEREARRLGYRTIQVCLKDLPGISRQASPEVS